jgi:hypothetical protein
MFFIVCKVKKLLLKNLIKELKSIYKAGLMYLKKWYAFG